MNFTPILGELPGTIWIWILGPFAIIALFLAVAALLSYRKMKFTPTTAIKDLQEGKVEVKGTVQARGPLLESPLSRSPCVCYVLFLDETIGSGKHSYNQTFFHEVKSAFFVVNDETGCATIKTDDLVWESGKAKHVALLAHNNSLNFDQTGMVKAISSSLGISQHGQKIDLPNELYMNLGTDRLERCDDIREVYLKDGDPLYIQGYARKIHSDSTERDPSKPKPQWEIGASPKKGKWNTGIWVSIKSEEENMATSYRVFKYALAIGLFLSGLLIIILLICNFILYPQ